MEHEQSPSGFRVEFDAVLNYQTSPSDGKSTSSSNEPGYLQASSTGVQQHFETPSVLGARPRFDKRALFNVALEDVSSLRWNEATGNVQLNTRQKQGLRAARPMAFSERVIAVDTADRLASLWFPGAVRERTEMTKLEQQLDDPITRFIGVVFMLAPIVAFVALLVAGFPIAVLAGAAVAVFLFALAGRTVLKTGKAERDEVAERVAQRMGWVEVVNPAIGTR